VAGEARDSQSDSQKPPWQGAEVPSQGNTVKEIKGTVMTSIDGDECQLDREGEPYFLKHFKPSN
jgi:hypothetical protein